MSLKSFFSLVSLSVAFCALTVGLPSSGHAQHLPRVAPEEVGMSSQHLAEIDRIVAEGIAQKKMPGCVVAVGHRGKLVMLKAYGNRRLFPEPEPMQTDTVFDMASITKPVATATSVMVLLEQGKIRLRDRVADIIPEFGVNGKDQITVHQLLTHQGGLIPDNALKDYYDGKQKAFERIYNLETYVEPGSKFVYTDVGFLLLADLVEKLSGKNVHEFSQEHIFGPLGMIETGYVPAESLQARCAVTEQREGEWIRGQVHDPRAYELNGIAGHAGLFSTAEDLAVYAQMMIGGGKYQGKRILSEATVQKMTKAYTVNGGTRGLGWDKATRYSSNRGELLSESAFGHGGFTGTVLWIDPELDLFYIFLSNRVHPNGKGSVNHLAGRIGSVIASAIDTFPSDESEQAEAEMPVKTGLDGLLESDFATLKGKRVGLITNHTALDSRGQWIVPLLHKSSNVNLTAIFSPEHGLAGKLDIPEIGDSQDSGTGMKVFSLYGKSRKPTPEQMQQVDCLVFDIQDIGARFYTYISTMGLAMEAAAESGKEFIVLDRPNPIGGEVVSGPMMDEDKFSFVGFHSLPVRHGMTVGELATMFQKERGLEDLKLTVVPVENWQRGQLYDETGLLWVNPSPNMRNLNQALLYPGIGLLETTNLSVGRGTDTPFEIFGAPWIKAQELSSELNGLNLPGVRFVPRKFTPESSVFADEECQGINILITDRETLQPIRTGFAIATTLRKLYPSDWEVDGYLRLLGNQRALDLLKSGVHFDKIMENARAGLQSFQTRRMKYLMY